MPNLDTLRADMIRAAATYLAALHETGGPDPTCDLTLSVVHGEPESGVALQEFRRSEVEAKRQALETPKPVATHLN